VDAFVLVFLACLSLPALHYISKFNVLGQRVALLEREIDRLREMMDRAVLASSSTTQQDVRTERVRARLTRRPAGAAASRTTGLLPDSTGASPLPARAEESDGQPAPARVSRESCTRSASGLVTPAKVRGGWWRKLHQPPRTFAAFPYRGI